MASRLLRSIAGASRLLRHTPLAKSKTLNRIQARIVKRIHGTHEARVGPFTVSFPPDDIVVSKRLILYGGDQIPEIQLLCSLVRTGDTVLDVGAHIGLYTLFMSRAVGPAGRVLAFEPDPVTIKYLERNVEKNGCQNVTIYPLALSDKSGRAKLFQDPDHRGASSLADLGDTGLSTEVPLRRGSELLTELRVSPRVVKIDVEGHEPQVIEGLGYEPAIIFFEFVPWQLRALGNNPLDFLERLHTTYSLRLIEPNARVAPAETPAGILELAEPDRVYNVLAMQGPEFASGLPRSPD